MALPGQANATEDAREDEVVESNGERTVVGVERGGRGGPAGRNTEEEEDDDDVPTSGSGNAGVGVGVDRTPPGERGGVVTDGLPTSAIPPLPRRGRGGVVREALAAAGAAPPLAPACRFHSVASAIAVAKA